jgi:hypothetical protein
MGAGAMKLRGYRDGDSALLTGPWLAGELLGVPVSGRPPLADPVTIAPPSGSGERPPSGTDEELCIAGGVAVIRYTELDWVHRRARVEIGVAPGHEDAAGALVRAAVDHGLRGLALSRLYGWVTPAAQPDTSVITSAWLRREASIPGSLWLAEELVAREIWAVTSDD